MKKLTREMALQKIEELKNFIKQEDNEFVRIDYDVIPKELFEKYNVKPFAIQKKKMRNEDGKVWSEIDYFEAQKECEKLCYRLPNVREMLMLLEYYKNVNKEILHTDKEFIGIEELSYDEDVCYEWIYNLEDIAFRRGGGWADASYAGVFALHLSGSPTHSSTTVGFRCVRDI